MSLPSGQYEQRQWGGSSGTGPRITVKERQFAAFPEEQQMENQTKICSFILFMHPDVCMELIDGVDPSWHAIIEATS